MREHNQNVRKRACACGVDDNIMMCFGGVGSGSITRTYGSARALGVGAGGRGLEMSILLEIRARA